MKAQSEAAQKPRKMKKLEESGGAVGRRENAIAQARTFALQAVQKPAGPDELSGKNTESYQNSDCARTWGDYHDDSYAEQSEAEYNFKVPLGLLDCPYHPIHPKPEVPKTTALPEADRAPVASMQPFARTTRKFRALQGPTALRTCWTNTRC